MEDMRSGNNRQCLDISTMTQWLRRKLKVHTEVGPFDLGEMQVGGQGEVSKVKQLGHLPEGLDG